MPAPGRNLQEKWIGFFVGKSLDEWIPRTYLQARYSFAFVEEVGRVRPQQPRSRSGPFLHAAVERAWGAVLAEDAWRHPVPIPLSDPLFPYHDQLAAEHFLNAGVGTTYATPGGMSLFMLFNTSIYGGSGHKLGRGVHIGFGYSFSQ